MVVFLGVSVGEEVVPLSRAINFWIGALLSVLALYWCQTDAVLHGYRLGWGTRSLVFVVAPVGLTVYLLSHRRWRSFLKLIVFAVCLVLSCGLLSMLTFRLYQGQWPF